jgi:tetratricopeptide (TPR) repeat protein
LQVSYGNQALILQDWGRLDEAMALHKKEEDLCTQLGDRAGLQVSYGNQALILQAWGRLDEAMALLKKQEDLCTQLGDRAGLARSYASQGGLLRDQGHPTEAKALLTQALEIFTALNMPRERDWVQSNLASLKPPRRLPGTLLWIAKRLAPRPKHRPPSTG